MQSRNIIPPVITKEQAKMIYASEADMLNVALFGKTAVEWRSENPDAKDNIRDEATLEQLIVLSNQRGRFIWFGEQATRQNVN